MNPLFKLNNSKGGFVRRKITCLIQLMILFIVLCWVAIPLSVEAQQRDHRERWLEEDSASAQLDFPRFSVGISSFALVYDDGISEHEFGGLAFQSTNYFNRNLALRGRFYNTENDYNEEISGLDLALLLGTDWGEGFNAFAGLGFYTENFETPEIYEALGIDLGDDSWSGYMLDFGIGYQWKHASLGLSGAIRDSSDLDSYREQNPGIRSVDGAYASGSLSIEYIF